MVDDKYPLGLYVLYIIILHFVGMVFVYALVQTAIWWLFHTTALFWKIRYPFHARSFQMSYKFKYLHVSCIIAGLLIPLLPIVASMISFAVELKSNTVLQNMNITFLSGGLGFRQVRFPPILCSGRNSDIIYYTSIFLINIIVIVGLTELILLFWTIHRVSCDSYYSVIPIPS